MQKSFWLHLITLFLTACKKIMKYLFASFSFPLKLSFDDTPAVLSSAKDIFFSETFPSYSTLDNSRNISPSPPPSNSYMINNAISSKR